MDFMYNQICALVFVLLPLSLLHSVEGAESTNVTFFSSADKTLNGACGYGEYGRTVNNGFIAVAAIANLYRNGAGCGACYKIKCKKAQCSENGVVVVATDYVGVGNETGFMLSDNAFTKMAQPGGEKALLAYRTLDVEYDRVSCQYPGKTLLLKVLEDSRYNSYLCMQFLYQAGSYDITAVQVFDDENLEWLPCLRAYGAVWNLSKPPKGPLTVKFLLDGESTVTPRWVLMRKVLPAFWEPGTAYDTEIQLD